MGLLNVYNNRNKVTSSALAVDYSCAGFEDNGHDRFKCTRTAKKRYKYVGMDKGTAINCAKKMRSLYTHEFWRETQLSGYANHNEFVIECPSGIQPTRGNGCMWDVDVAVNETDTIVTTSCLSTIAQFETVFAPVISARQYEEDDFKKSELTLYGVTRYYNDDNVICLKIDFEDKTGQSIRPVCLASFYAPDKEVPSGQSRWTSLTYSDENDCYYGQISQYVRPQWIILRQIVSGQLVWSNTVYLAPKEFN